MKRLIAPLIIGLLGAAILLALGVWQVQRLQWKQAILHEIASTVSGDPQPIPEKPVPATDRYQPVALSGRVEDGEAHVLVSRKEVGAGYRVIAPFVTDDGRRVLIDRGFIPTDAKETARRTGETSVRGNLYWPRERGGFTPENDLEDNIWYARDVPQLADHFGTEPLLVVASAEDPAPEGVTPLPVSTAGIPNDHLQYAITWFALAAVWLGMTVVWIRRGRSETRGQPT